MHSYRAPDSSDIKGVTLVENCPAPLNSLFSTDAVFFSWILNEQYCSSSLDSVCSILLLQIEFFGNEELFQVLFG